MIFRGMTMLSCSNYLSKPWVSDERMMINT